MAPQGLPPSRMALLEMLLGLLMASCFTFCLSHQNPVNILAQIEESCKVQESFHATEASVGVE